MKSAWRLFGCCLGLLLLSLQRVGDLQAFAIFPPNHQIITQQALGNCCFEYTLPNGAKVTFSAEATTSVMAGNMNMDILSLKDEQLAEDFHFDDERFDFGQFVLLFTRDLIVVQLQDEAFAQSDPQSLLRQQMLTRTSREMLGNALHTLQDYYAHTNWVERSLQNGIHLPINPVLGAKGKILHGPSAQTCDENAPGLSQLTSGYYLASGVFDCANICSAPATECAHGNIACPGLDCGINKDVSPRDHYAEAFDLATQHTEVFTRQIFDEALGTDPLVRNRVSIAICQFMGVPDPTSTCSIRHSVTVQKLNQANGQATQEGLVQSSGGTVTPTIHCGVVCQGMAITGTSAILTASDAGNWRFVRWAESGVCPGSTNPQCNVTVDGNKLARAEFTDEPLPEPTSFEGEIILTGPAGITGTGCTGTMTLTGTATVNLESSPTLAINGSESINLSCYSSTGPVSATVQLSVVGNSISGQFIGPFTCPPPCVSGQSIYNVQLLRSGTGSNQILQGVIEYINENQTPFLATTSGAVTLPAQ